MQAFDSAAAVFHGGMLHASCVLLAKARVVKNHSTHCEGLLSALDVLARQSAIFKSIIPGRIATAAGQTAGLKLKLGVPTAVGFKLIARKGSQVQEVFLVTESGVLEVQAELERCLPEHTT